MSYEKVKEYLDSIGMGDRIVVRELTIDTVEHAAQSIGCEPKQIAKTMSFLHNDAPILIVMAGDAKVDNAKYKKYYKQKAAMIPFDRVEELVGHAPGGVCPFAMKEGIKVYLDESLKRFDYVYAAGGNTSATVKIAPHEFDTACPDSVWVDVCKGWQE